MLERNGSSIPEFVVLRQDFGRSAEKRNSE